MKCKGVSVTMTNKPRCKLVGTDSNIFALLGTASRCLKKAGQHDNATEMQARVFASHSYDAALAIICDYVEVY